MVNQVTNRILGLGEEVEPAQFSEMGGKFEAKSSLIK